MQGVLIAELAVLFLLQLFGRLFLVYKRNIVAAFALCALKTDDVSHFHSLQTNINLKGAAALSRPAHILLRYDLSDDAGADCTAAFAYCEAKSFLASLSAR